MAAATNTQTISAHFFGLFDPVTQSVHIAMFASWALQNAHIKRMLYTLWLTRQQVRSRQA